MKAGVVLSAEKFFDDVYVDIFFKKTGERRTLPLSGLLEQIAYVEFA
jgi:hypothetical protein